MCKDEKPKPWLPESITRTNISPKLRKRHQNPYNSIKSPELLFPLEEAELLILGAVTVRLLPCSLLIPLGLAAGLTDPGRLEASTPPPRLGEECGTEPSVERFEEESCGEKF